MVGGGGGGGMRPNTATSYSFAFAFASTTLSTPCYKSLSDARESLNLVL